MYEIKINDQEVIKSSWPIAWVYSRVLKAICKANIIDSVADNYNAFRYHQFTFICESIPRIRNIWGGEKLIKIRQID